LAYGFDLFTKEPDTVVSVDIYWPQFGNNTSQTVILKMWNSSGGLPSGEIYRQTITVNRTSGNQFTTYKLTDSVGVKGRFFIGWEQTADVVVPAGLDKNTNSGEEIYFNITGTWEQNQNVLGSLMIRPTFGNGRASVITSVAEEQRAILFPNPNQGEFYIPASAENITITSMLGNSTEFKTERITENIRVILSERTPGIILVRWHEKGKLFTAKALVFN
jgi:hypothetical protein